MHIDTTNLADNELIVALSEQRALLGESIANDYGCDTVDGVTRLIGELEAEVDRRGLLT
ncbi:hypothetical protein [Rhodococcus marinonascens]|uniref:hypothetical protein n=1 Tax=Rhodococcus marinonascens TaxID=38311 RepID=UPI000A9921E2|nr:hypothetical protein [Rhodococcus marinonascens]